MSKKVKAKATPKAAATDKQNKSAEDVLNGLDGITEVIVVDADLYDIIYDEALLEEAAILAALEAEDYEVVFTDCGC